MTPTQRRYLEHAVRCQGGELRWTVRTSGEGTIHRMVKHLVAAGLVAFDAKRMAWVVTRAGRAVVKEGPPHVDGSAPIWLAERLLRELAANGKA